MRPIHVNPAGERISIEEAKILRDTVPDPYLLRQFDDGKIRMNLLAARTVPRVAEVPREHWKMFEVQTWNIVSTDPVTNEPIDPPKVTLDKDACKYFRTRPEAEGFFESFLAQYTESKFDETTGQFKEVGNIHTPPDPDVPVVQEDSPVASEFGSW